MASENGEQNHNLATLKYRNNSDYDQFLEDSIHYNFFAAMRLLENLNQSRFGETKKPKDDPILLGQQAHLGFVPTAIAGHRITTKSKQNWLDIYFFGLFGPNGPLPLHMSEQAYAKLPKEEQQNMREFMDIFHHRLISLFYRAWANKEPLAQLDIASEDKFHFYTSALAGYGVPSLKNRDLLSDYPKARFANYLGGKTRHREGLQNMIKKIMNVDSKVINFSGEWLKIPTSFFCHLKEPHYAKKLGVDTTLGKYSWQCQYKFNVYIGPLTYKTYKTLLPGTKKLKLLNDIIKNYVKDEMEWEVILVLKGAEVPESILGKKGNKNNLLGWTTWIKNTSATIDAYGEKSYKHNVADIRLHCKQI